MVNNPPGKSYRKGLALLEISDMFSTEEKPRKWLEDQRWPDGVSCPRCGSHNKEHLNAGRGVGMTAVVGMKDRKASQVAAQSVSDTSRNTLQGFVAKLAEGEAIVYTDDAKACSDLPYDHESVKHNDLIMDNKLSSGARA